MRSPWIELLAVASTAWSAAASAASSATVSSETASSDTAWSAGDADVEVLVADAGRTDSYAGRVPAEVVLVCGVFGNISDAVDWATERVRRATNT